MASFSRTFYTYGVTHGVIAYYSGDANFTPYRVDFPCLIYPKNQATVTVGSAPNPSAFGQLVTLTSSVTPVVSSLGLGTPTGTVTFKSIQSPNHNAIITTIGTVPLAGGVATLDTTALPSGAIEIAAEYNGDTNFEMGQVFDPVLNQTVNPAVSTTALTSGPNPSAFGQAVTFTATVTSSVGTPTGTVTFMDGTTTLGTGTLSGDTASFSTTALAAGGRSITAAYGGDTNFAASTSSPLTQTVKEPLSNVNILSPMLLTGSSTTVLANINFVSLLPTNGDFSTFQAYALAADASSAAIVLVNTGSAKSVKMTLTASQGSLFAYKPNFLTTAPTANSKPITVVSTYQIGSNWYAAAWLQAPADGSANFSSAITVTAQIGTKSYSSSISLLPPPVMFLHGLWGTSTSLQYTQQFLQTQSPYNSSLVQAIPAYLFASLYSGVARFDDIATLSQVAAEIHNQLYAVNSAGVIAGRVDVVAHSMGGLVSRALTKFSGYESVMNRNQGMIHQIDTLDTPELGSNLASYLLGHEGATLDASANTGPWLAWEGVCGVDPSITLGECFAVLNQPIGGAVQSLEPTDPGLKNATKPNVPKWIWRAIASQAAVDSLLASEINLLLAAAIPPPIPTVNTILGTNMNDAVVTTASQSSFSKSGNIAHLSLLSHASGGNAFLAFALGSDDANVTKSDQVNAIVGCWLLEAGSSTCNNLPASQPVAGSRQTPVDLARLSLVPAQLMIPGNPIPNVGEPLHVDVARPDVLAVFVTQQDESGNYVADEQLLVSLGPSGRSGFDLVPKLIGKVTFTIRTVFKDKGFSFDKFTGQVRIRPGVTQAFYADLNFSSLRLQLPTAQYHLTPVASFPGLDQPVYVSGHVKYKVISGRNVATVGPDGTIRGLTPGSARISAKLGNFEAFIDVLVE